MRYQIVISIINYRTGDLTLQCVRTVLDNLAELAGSPDGAATTGRIVVVDNASGDGSDDQIADWIAAQPDPVPVDLVRSATNTGFSGGHNIGLSTHEADYYLVLNSDAVLRPDFLRSIIAAGEANPRAGLIAPQIETDDGQIQVSCFRFHSLYSEFIRGAGSGPVTRLLARHVLALEPPVAPEQIEWASFACIMLRAEMINDIGLMDDGYFLYFEDAEYCLRARRAGWRIHQDTSAVAVHFRGGSGPVKALEKAKKRLPPYFYASRTRFFAQRYGRAGPVLANLIWHLGRLLAQGRRLLGKPVPVSIQNEARDLWTNALVPLGPRRAPGETP